MEIKTSLFEGNYDFEIKLDEYKPQGESVFQLTLGEDIFIITRDEWEKLYNLVSNSMDFLDDNCDNEQRYCKRRPSMSSGVGMV